MLEIDHRCHVFEIGFPGTWILYSTYGEDNIIRATGQLFSPILRDLIYFFKVSLRLSSTQYWLCQELKLTS